MVLERVKVLKERGHIHYFTLDKLNFVYSRERNQTYQIDNAIYSNLVSQPSDLSDNDSKTIHELLDQLKRDYKSNISFYTLYISSGGDLKKHEREIKDNSYLFDHSEVVFKTDNDNQIQDAFDEQQLLEFSDYRRHDLFFIKEERISSVSGNMDFNLANMNAIYKVIYDINLPANMKLSEVGQVSGQFALEYSPEREDEIIDFVKNNNVFVNLHSSNLNQSQSFFKYLVDMLKKDNDTNNNIYNYNGISDFLLSGVVFKRTIGISQDNEVELISNNTCNKCWAKNICWVTKSFKFFNVDLKNIEKYNVQCTYIKGLIEHIIVKLRLLENLRKQKLKENYNFDGDEIKLVN